MRSILHSFLKAVASLPVLQTGDQQPEGGVYGGGGGGNSSPQGLTSGGSRWNGGGGDVGYLALCEGT